MTDRRQFLGLGWAAASTYALSASYSAAAAAATQLTLVPLTGRLSLVQGAAANIVVASANNTLLLVDGGAAVDAKVLQKLLAKHFPGQMLRAVFNTHWHAVHTGYNATARKMGVDVIAHENTRLWLSTEVNSRWEGKVYKPQPAAALPNRTFYYDAQAFDFAGAAVQYAHLGQAHTDGDIYVRFPEENVIVAGGVLTPGRYPIVDTACNGYLGGINTALRTIGALSDGQTRLVPGRGPVSGLPVLQQQLEMGSTVLARMSDHYRKGGSFAEFVATHPTREFDAQYGEPTQFLRQTFDSAWYQVSTMGGLAVPPPASPGSAR
jgi:glyoxylase-like metal-dependent hydrolase (beta-lactamase superfamily II)